MKAYDLTLNDGYNTSDSQLNDLSKQAGYVSPKGMLDCRDWWFRDVAEIKAILVREINTPAE